MTKVSKQNVAAAGWRFKLGVAMFGLSIALPVLGVPLVAAVVSSAAAVATISGVLLVSAEVLGVAAIAIMGKKGFAYIKDRVSGFFKRYGPPAEVGRTRYKIGLVMFAISIFFGWVSPYLASKIPGYLGKEWIYHVVSDVLLLISLFVLGGDFWEKIRALFFHQAKAMFPKTID
jgi:hypothetical protein